MKQSFVATDLISETYSGEFESVIDQRNDESFLEFSFSKENFFVEDDARDLESL